MHETFLDLLRSPAHWGIEITVTIVVDGLVLGLVWPWLRKHVGHHIDRDKREGIASLSKATKRVLCISQYRGIYAVGKR